MQYLLDRVREAPSRLFRARPDIMQRLRISETEVDQLIQHILLGKKILI